MDFFFLNESYFIAEFLNYSNYLNTYWLVWYSNGRFVSGCHMVWYLNGGLKSGLKKACWKSKMSGIWMVCQVTWLYHMNTWHPYCPLFRCLEFRWLLLSPIFKFVKSCPVDKCSVFQSHFDFTFWKTGPVFKWHLKHSKTGLVFKWLNQLKSVQ